MLEKKSLNDLGKAFFIKILALVMLSLFFWGFSKNYPKPIVYIDDLFSKGASDGSIQRR